MGSRCAPNFSQFNDAGIATKYPVWTWASKRVTMSANVIFNFFSPWYPVLRLEFTESLSRLNTDFHQKLNNALCNEVQTPKSVSRRLIRRADKGFRHPAGRGWRGYHGQQNEVGEPQTGNCSPRSQQCARHCRWLYP